MLLIFVWVFMHSMILFTLIRKSFESPNEHYKLHTVINISYIRGYQDVPLLEFMDLVLTRMPGDNYRRRLRSLLLYLCYVFRALLYSVVSILHERSGPLSVEISYIIIAWLKHQLQLDISVQCVMTQWEISVQLHQKYSLELTSPPPPHTHTHTTTTLSFFSALFYRFRAIYV